MSDQISLLEQDLWGPCSTYLKKEGFDVQIFEKRKDPRKSAIAEGRSINLALSRRGILPLKAAGVFDRIEPF